MWNWLVKKMMAIGQSRNPDFVVGGVENPYLRRWFVIPRNPIFNIYLHQFLRDDDDRALHDHPWAWCSILLRGCYVEHSVEGSKFRRSGSVFVSGPRRAHRVALLRRSDGGRFPCWTLFITGPRVRTWGFHCPKGWVPWQEFTNPNDSGVVGRGCGESE